MGPEDKEALLDQSAALPPLALPKRSERRQWSEQTSAQVNYSLRRCAQI